MVCRQRGPCCCINKWHEVKSSAFCCITGFHYASIFKYGVMLKLTFSPLVETNARLQYPNFTWSIRLKEHYGNFGSNLRRLKSKYAAKFMLRSYCVPFKGMCMLELNVATMKKQSLCLESEVKRLCMLFCAQIWGFDSPTLGFIKMFIHQMHKPFT